VGSWLDRGEENGSLKLPCMHHKPHSLTVDLEREEGKKISEHQTGQRNVKRGCKLDHW